VSRNGRGPTPAAHQTQRREIVGCRSKPRGPADKNALTSARMERRGTGTRRSTFFQLPDETNNCSRDPISPHHVLYSHLLGPICGTELCVVYSGDSTKCHHRAVVTNRGWDTPVMLGQAHVDPHPVLKSACAGSYGPVFFTNLCGHTFGLEGPCRRTAPAAPWCEQERLTVSCGARGTCVPPPESHHCAGHAPPPGPDAAGRGSTP